MMHVSVWMLIITGVRGGQVGQIGRKGWIGPPTSF